MVKILLTGACGFIGSHLCRAFIARGYKVIGVDNLITSSRDNLRDIIKNKNFLFIEHDISKELYTVREIFIS